MLNWVHIRETIQIRDDNGAGFFGYPPRSAPNGTEFKFNKQVWDGYEIFIKIGAGSSIVSSHPAQTIYKIKFKIKFNLKFYFTIFNI